jgi:hypothetical protein
MDSSGEYQDAVRVITPNGHKKKHKLMSLYDLRIFHKNEDAYLRQ